MNTRLLLFFLNYMVFIIFFISCNTGVEVISAPHDFNDEALDNSTNGHSSTTTFLATLEMPLNQSSLGTSPVVNLLVKGVKRYDLVKLYIDAFCTIEVGSVVSESNVSLISSKYLLPGINIFYFQVLNSSEKSRCFGGNISYTFGLVPHAPEHLSHFFPSTVKGTFSNPSFLISSIQPGDRVNLFYDSFCTKIAGNSISKDTSVVVTTNLQSPGIYTFFSQLVNVFGTSSCSKIGITYHYSPPPIMPTQVLRVTPIELIGSSPTPIFKIQGVSHGDEVKLYVDPLCLNEIGATVADSTYTLIKIGPLSPGKYQFFANTRNPQGTSPCSKNFAQYEFGTPPEMPNELKRIVPLSIQGFISNPEFVISGVSSGDHVKLFIDESCSQMVGEKTANANSVIIRTLPLKTGTYDFYATATNTYGQSPCSIMSVRYIYLTGFPPVTPVELNAGLRDEFKPCGFEENTINDKITDCSQKNNGSTVVVNASEGKIWKLVFKSSLFEVWKDLKTNLVWSDHLGDGNWCEAVGDVNSDLNSQCWRLNLQPSFPLAESFCNEEIALKTSAKNEFQYFAFSLDTWRRMESKSLYESWFNGIYHEAKGFMGLAPTNVTPSVKWRLPGKDEIDASIINGIKEVVFGGRDFKIWSSTVYSNNRYSYRWYGDGSQRKTLFADLRNHFSIRCVF